MKDEGKTTKPCEIKDEGGRMKDEGRKAKAARAVVAVPSSFIPHPLSFVPGATRDGGRRKAEGFFFILHPSSFILSQ
jgi:hypothetical protein